MTFANPTAFRTHRPPPAEFNCKDPGDFARHDAERKALYNACEPIVVEYPAASFKQCVDARNRPKCSQYHECQEHLRQTGRLLGDCEASLEGGYKKGVKDTTLSRGITAALRNGPLTSPELYAAVNPPDFESLAPDEKETWRGHVEMTLDRMIRARVIVRFKRAGLPGSCREYRLVAQEQTP